LILTIQLLTVHNAATRACAWSVLCEKSEFWWQTDLD
jgi:hypothetical protein